MLLVSCTADHAGVRPIEATLLVDCPLDDTSALELEALDDGPPSASSFVEVPLEQAAEVATLPAGARTFLARGRDAGGTFTALGVLSVRDDRASGPLYRVGSACAFRDGNGAPARFPRVLAPAVASSARFAVLAGGRDGDGERSDVLVIDGERAVAERLGMRRRRSGATVSVLESRALIAGGSAGAEVWEDAEIVDLSAPRVLTETVALSEKRTEAASVVLGTGEILLVGGRGPSGVLRTMEVVDPERRVARTIDVASLARARRAPIALRIATGEILVLGGFDEAGAPVPDVEVFDANARGRIATLPFAPLGRSVGVALPSGAALIVHHDDKRTGAALVRPDGVEALRDPEHGGVARLVPGTDGAPFLFNGLTFRYDPFAQRFVTIEAPLSGELEPFSLDGGVLAFARSEASQLAIRAIRYDLRPPLVVDTRALGLGDSQHLCPDRPGPAVTRDGLLITPRARVAVTDATFRGLTLRLGASGRDLPAVELRGEDGALVARIDDVGACAWPPSSGTFGEIVREANGSISVRVGDATRSCAPLVARERVWVTLVAGTAEARVHGVTITRR